MPTSAARWWVGGVGLCLLAGMPVQAGLLEGEPYAALKIEHDNNLFRYADDAEALAVSGSTERADTTRRQSVGVALRYSLSLQQFFAGAELRETHYQRFKNLDNKGHEYGGGWNWRFGRLWSGLLRLRSEKDLQSFADRNNTQLSFQTQRRAEAEARLAITPRWAMQARLSGYRQRYSLASSQNFDLNENTGALGLEYALSGLSSAGLRVERTQGKFPRRDAATLGTGVASEYEQLTTQLRAGYTPSGLSDLRLELGHTERDNQGNQARGFSGLTGRLAYERRASGKTRLAGELFRQLQNVEEVDANFIEQTGLALSLRYQPTPLIGSFIKAERYGDRYQGAGAAVVAGAPRKDEVILVSAGIEYKPFFWLKLAPAVRRESRESNRSDRRYNDTQVSLEIEARYD